MTHTPVVLREHCKDEAKGLDRVKLSNQKGPLGSFDRADARRLAASWNALSGISTEQIECLPSGYFADLLGVETDHGA